MALLLVCDGCHRHVRAQDERCPFCGTARSDSALGRAPRATAVFVSLAIAGCTQRPQAVQGSSAASIDAHAVTAPQIALDAEPLRESVDAELSSDASSTLPDDVLASRAGPSSTTVTRAPQRRDLLSALARIDGGLAALLNSSNQSSTAPMYGAPPIDPVDAAAYQNPDRPRGYVVLRDLQLAAPSTVPVDLRAIALRFQLSRGALVQCMSAALRADPELHGDVTLQLVVEGERVVGETRVSSAPSAELGSCFARVLRGARISPPVPRVALIGRWMVQPQR